MEGHYQQRPEDPNCDNRARDPGEDLAQDLIRPIGAVWGFL